MFAIAVTSLATSHQSMIYQNAAWAPSLYLSGGGGPIGPNVVRQSVS